MPNYKSKMLTFLSIGEMTSLLLDNTDEDGLLFAVATDSTNFKIVMWRKNSTAPIDNELVFPVNGPGRWHVLPVGESNSQEVLTVIGDNLPSSIGPETEIIIQKKSDGSNVLKGRFNGIFEDVASGGGGGSGVVYLPAGQSLPPTPENEKTLYIVEKGFNGIFYRHVFYIYLSGNWVVCSAENIEEDRWSGDSLRFTAPETLGQTGFIQKRSESGMESFAGDRKGQMIISGASNGEDGSGNRIWVYIGYDAYPLWQRLL